MHRQPSRALALLEALLISMVWGSSFIFVKIALIELGPLTIGGLRYFLGFVCLLPFLRRRSFTLTRTQWLRMALLGFSAYTLANGALFWALRFLPATTGSFLMSLITVTVLLGGIFWLREDTQPPTSRWYFDRAGGHGAVLFSWPEAWRAAWFGDLCTRFARLHSVWIAQSNCSY